MEYLVFAKPRKFTNYMQLDTKYSDVLTAKLEAGLYNDSFILVVDTATGIICDRIMVNKTKE